MEVLQGNHEAEDVVVLEEGEFTVEPAESDQSAVTAETKNGITEYILKEFPGITGTLKHRYIK